MASCDHDRPPSLAEDLAIARAVADHDPKHAAFHVACALAVDARHGEALELADRIIGASVDPRALTTIEAGAYYGIVAFHCRVLWHTGERDEAVKLLGQVIGVRPDVGYATWLGRWVNEVDSAAAAIAIERAARTLADAGEPARDEVIAACKAAATRHPGDDRVACMYGRALRSSGRVAEALEVLHAADAKHRTYMTGVVLATTQRHAGDRETAVATLRELCARFPDDDAIYLDLGDNLLDLDRFDDAAVAYETVVAREPHHDWARPSRLYARFLASGDGKWRDELEDLAQVESAQRARALAKAIAPYVGYLPGRPESVLKVADQLRANPPGNPLTMATSSMEAPSAVFAFDRFVRAHGGSLDVSTHVPDPDPRVARRPVDFPTWRYDGITPVPAVAPPPAAVGEALAAIAKYRFDGAAWTEHAREVAGTLGTDAAADVIAAMIHTSEPPSWSTPWGWSWRVAVAGALVLAALDDGWEGSVRKRALLALVDGPVDWLATAGLVALARTADREPAMVATVARILDDAAAVPVTPIHHMCLVEPAVRLLVQLPGASPTQRSARRSRRAELDA